MSHFIHFLDLGIAASIGKSLLENNIALRARQESLLARASINTPSPPASLLARRLDNPRSNVSEVSCWFEAIHFSPSAQSWSLMIQLLHEKQNTVH